MVLSQVIADRLGMNPTDLECLGILLEHGPVPAGRLAELTGLTTGAITGVVDRLERAGYARRERDPEDRRRVFVQPQMERIEAIGPLFIGLAEAMNTLLEHYNEHELRLILDFAVRSNTIVQDHIARLQQETASGRSGASRKTGRDSPPNA